jgi:hypothetical protein
MNIISKNHLYYFLKLIKLIKLFKIINYVLKIYSLKNK